MTAGPWKFTETTLGICRGFVTVEDVDAFHVESEKGESVGYLHRKGEEEIANAHLVAAAPELLEACKKQHQAIDTLLAMLISRDREFMPSESAVWPLLVSGHAAIKKAEGRA